MVLKANVEWQTDPVIAPGLIEDEWLETRQRLAAERRHGRKSCFCVGCGAPMHPKEIRETKTRFFAHDPAPGAKCHLAMGESACHHRHKTSLYRAILKVPGWAADVEQATGEVDPETGRPAIVDVVAQRMDLNNERSGRVGWEVQLSAMDVGAALNRQQIREQWLRRCIWVTEKRFAWAGQLPWYQIGAESSDHPSKVVAGVVALHNWGTGRGTDYLPVAPFPGDEMVSLVLREQVEWVDALEGFRLRGAVADPVHVRRRAAERKGKPQDRCDRVVEYPIGDCRGCDRTRVRFYGDHLCYWCNRRGGIS